MSVRQLEESEWKEIACPVHLCTLPFMPAEFTRRFAVRFFDYNEEGLGPAKAAVVEAGGTLFWLSAFPDGPEPAKHLTVSVQSFEANSSVALDRLLTGLGISASDLVWCRSELGPADWILFRIDDNGNEVEVQRFLEQDTADRVMCRYEQGDHKQTYLVRKRG